MNQDSSSRGKTYRKSHSVLDVSGAVALGFYEKTFQFLHQDAENALHRPWHKIERGLRIGRLRDFVEREKARLTLNADDEELLFKLLIKGLDRKILNSKASVTYDTDKEQITEIKGLVAHTTATGSTKYSLIEKKPVATQKRRQVSAAATTTGPTVQAPATQRDVA
uniref:Uncharacterized protein n=1 Tax=viral metagenome TaxID=1070528 RepID=A0A6C0KB05_9ZZZZ